MSQVFTMPKKVITGQQALSDAKDTLKGLGKKAFIVTGKHVVKIDFFKTLEQTLEEAGVTYTVFDGITGEPTDTMIEEGVQAYQESGSDFLIGIGGGSPLDAMKAIAVIATLGGSIASYMGKMIDGVFPPMVAIPTTAGTGSETTKFTIITDSKQDIKMLLKGENLVPDVAIIDDAASLTSPQSITASTGLDALTHAVESYTSKLAQPLTDTMALSAVKRIMTYLPIAYKEGTNVEARKEMALAAFEAGVAINNASVTIVHGMSRPIGALFHVPHGISNAMLLPSCMKFAVGGAVERFATLGRAIGLTGEDEVVANQFIEALESLCQTCEIPTLKAYGIDQELFFEKIDKMANDALASGSPGQTRKEVSYEAIVKLYEGLW